MIQTALGRPSRLSRLLLCSTLMHVLVACGWSSSRQQWPGSSEAQSISLSRSLMIEFQDSVSFKKISQTSSPSTSFFWNDRLFEQQWYLRNTGQVVARLEPGLPDADIRLPTRAVHTGALNPGAQHARAPNLSIRFPGASETPVVVALIDTGLEFSHPDFDSHRILKNPGESGLDEHGHDKANNQVDDDGNGYADDVWGWNFADGSPIINDTLGHGTHLAGLLISKPDNDFGIASPWTSFKLLPIQIFSGARPSVPAGTIAAAIRYAADRGAQVINASFGTPSSSDDIRAALEYARGKDVVVVSAVGNFRRNLDDEPSYPASYHFENQIAVAASDNRDLAAPFSNFGSRVDVFAPGSGIVSTGLQGSFVARSGTSQAAPLVAGVAAELRARFPEKTALQIKQMILDAADERTGLVGFSRSGRRLNFDNALRMLRGQRIVPFEPAQTQRLTYHLESEHPYRGGLRTSYRLDLGEDVGAFRVHFERFASQSTDTLLIRDARGQPVQLLSGALGDFWTAPITGSHAVLEFHTDAFVSDWGWKIDSIELVARSSYARSP